MAKGAKGNRSFKFVGDKQIAKELRRLEKKIPDAVQDALVEEAMDIFAESQIQVPVEYGPLQDSGAVGVLPGGKGVVISYGKEYALPVHDRDEVRHAPPTKSRFLEDPFNDAMAGMNRRLIVRARRLAKI